MIKDPFGDDDNGTISLGDIVTAWINKCQLPYTVYIDPDPIQAETNVGIKSSKHETGREIGTWLAWVYNTEVKSYWKEELICLKASDPDFFPMLEFWLAFNNEMRKDRDD